MLTPMDMRHHHLHAAPRELLAYVPHGGGQLRQGGWRLGPLRLQGIELLVKARVELLPEGLPLFSCTDLGYRDNLRTTHG